MKITKKFAKENGIVFYPAYAYRSFPNSSNILKEFATYSGEKAIKKANQMVCDDDSVSVFTKIGEQWYEVLKEVSNGSDFIVKKENNEQNLLLSKVIKNYKISEAVKKYKNISKSKEKENDIAKEL